MNEFKYGKTITENGADEVVIKVDMTATTTEAYVAVDSEVTRTIVSQTQSDTELEYDEDD